MRITGSLFAPYRTGHVSTLRTPAGLQVVATDVGRGIFDTPSPVDWGGFAPPWNYQQCDLTDAGEVFSMVARFQPDVVVSALFFGPSDPTFQHVLPFTSPFICWATAPFLRIVFNAC